MNAYMKKVLVFLLAISLIWCWLPPVEGLAEEQADLPVMLADFYAGNDDLFAWSAESRLFVIAALEPSGSLLQTAQLLQRQFAADGKLTTEPMALVWGHEKWVRKGDVVLELNGASGIGSEGYRLDVTDTVRVVASDVDGLLYGGNMLLKQLRLSDDHTLKGFTSTDVPDTLQRAVSLDCGRKYYSKNWICNFIREISWMGYNTLELHFSDDSGFRMDFWDDAYYTDSYRPANDFSWICGSNYTSWTLSAYKNDPDQGKYLTTAEVIEILDTAKEYHIEVIPAFDSPSHLDYINWMYEQNYKKNSSYSFYSTYDDIIYYARDVKGIINYTNSSGWSTPLNWPYYSTVNVVNDQAKAFVYELYMDIADFFKTYAQSEDFSIGADEVNLNTDNLAYGYQFAWGFPDFVAYINELNAVLNRKGYTMRMYNDFIGSTAYHASEYDFADNIEILYWDSPFEPNTGGEGAATEPVSYYVDRGSVLYNCIQTNTYYALRITGSGSDARSVHNRQWTFYHANEEDIYHEWYPADFSEHGDYSEEVPEVPEEYLGGAYFLIWCDYSCVNTEVQIWNGCYDATVKNTGEFYSLRDRMWSNITKMWNWDINETVSFDAFANLRDAYGDFPGCGTGTNACSEEAVLPPAAEMSSAYIDLCERYPSYCQVRVLQDAPIMTLPCLTETEIASVELGTVAGQEICTVLGLTVNPEGKLWYAVKSDNGKTGYLSGEATEVVSVLSDDLDLTDASVPSGHVQGERFAAAGVLQSPYQTITYAEVSVFRGFGMDDVVLQGERISVMGNRCNLEGYEIALEELPLGEYTFVVATGYQGYYIQDGVLTEYTGDSCMMERYFLVLEKAGDQTSCSHCYQSSVIHPADCRTEGEAVYFCRECGHIYEQTVDITDHMYEEEHIPATCLEYTSVRYTCITCGYSYDAYEEDIYSQWQDGKPEAIDERYVQSKVVYSYSDYEVMDSPEAALEGYTQLEASWQAEGQGSISYVSSWPAGFQQSSDLYLQYNQADSKVAEYETDTDKCAITADHVTGYLYYHWCYANSYYSLANSSEAYTTFHAYYSTTAPGNYICDYSDMSYCTAHATCSNSQWFFVTPVNTQEYTEYSKVYHYERWTDWSQWSDLPVAATDTRKVETKTVYRYVVGSLAGHQWEEGVCVACEAVCEHKLENGYCTVCGEVCDHRFQNNSCLFCGCPKPEMDLFLFGCINGIDYPVEEITQMPETFRFRDGQLTMFFSQDSEIAVTSRDPRYCYMTDGDLGALSSAVLYNVNVTEHGGLLYIPGNMLVTLELTDQGDDTYLLSYTAVPCPHETHSCEGICLICAAEVEHLFLPEVTEPTCTVSGYTTYTCICGGSYIADETEALGHSFLDGVCISCDEPKPVTKPALNLLYPALSFEDEVKIHVFFSAENMEQVMEIGLIVYSEEVSSWGIETAETVIPGYQQINNDAIYYCSTNGIHAKALGDRLYFSVYLLTQGGEYVYSPLRNYSPADYAYNHLNNSSTSPEVKALVVAMLNYGAAAQRYFGYHSEEPVNAALTDEQKAMVTEYSPDMTEPVQQPDADKVNEFAAVSDSFSKKRPAVSFKGAFAIEYFLAPAHTPDGDVRLYYWDQDTYDRVESCRADNAAGILVMTRQEDGQYHASVEGISAKDLDRTVFAASVYSDGTQTFCSGILSYHIGAYCASFAATENDARELATLTAVYGYYAKAYFG